jgi:hypothetical protein
MLVAFFQHVFDLVASAGATLLIAIFGAVLSAINITYTIFDKVTAKRLRLATTYFFTRQDGVPDTITIVNLSPFAVHISYWCLQWRPTLLRQFLATVAADESDPEDSAVFTIPAQNSYTLKFFEPDKFDWSYRTARHRKLYLTLDIFGHGRKKLKIGARM